MRKSAPFARHVAWVLKNNVCRIIKGDVYLDDQKEYITETYEI